MLTAVEAATALVVTVKVALVPPAAMVTLAGTEAAALLSESWTTAPPAGAGPSIMTVPVTGVPPVTLALAQAERRDARRHYGERAGLRRAAVGRRRW